MDHVYGLDVERGACAGAAVGWSGVGARYPCGACWFPCWFLSWLGFDVVSGWRCWAQCGPPLPHATLLCITALLCAQCVRVWPFWCFAGSCVWTGLRSACVVGRWLLQLRVQYCVYPSPCVCTPSPCLTCFHHSLAPAPAGPCWPRPPYPPCSLVVSPVGGALGDFATLIARDVKAHIFAKQRSDMGQWIAGTSLEDLGAVEEFFGAMRAHMHSLRRRGAPGSTAAGFDVEHASAAGLAGIGALFHLPPDAAFEAKLLSVLAILSFCPPIATSVCRNLLPSIIREYNWAECPAPAKLITRICTVIVRGAGQVCMEELTGTGTLAVLVRNVTTTQGKYALKVRGCGVVVGMWGSE